MKTIINRDDSRRIYAAESFTDVYDFINTLSAREINDVFLHNDELFCSKIDQFHEGEYWTGTRTYEDSMRIFRNGFSEGVEILRCKVRNVVDETPRPRSIDAIIGDAPNVPNFLKGIPTNMIYRKRMKVAVPMCTIYYDRASYGSVSSGELASAAARVLNVVSTLEAKGIRVALNIARVSYVEHQVVACIVNVKRHTSPMNLLKISYPAIHPAFYRRQMFHWMESSPIVTATEFSDGYGAPFSHMCSSIEGRRDLLRTHNIIADNDIYLDFGFVQKSSVSTLVNYIERESKASRS